MDRNVRQRVAEPLQFPPCPLVGPIAREVNYTLDKTRCPPVTR